MTHIVVDPVTRIEGHLRIEAEVDGGARQGRVVLVHDVPRHRADPARPRPARRLGLRPADLRRVHDRARDRVDPRRRERHRRGAAAQRAPAPQPDHRGAVRAGPRRSTSTICTRWTGSTSSRALERRPGQDRHARPIDLRLAAVEREVFRRRARPTEGRSSSAASSGRSPTPTGATPRTGCRRRPTSWRSRTTSRRSTGSASSSGSTRSSAARTRTCRASSSAAWRRRSIPTRRTRSTWTRIAALDELIAKARDFVSRVYIPDVLAVAVFYKDWASIGAGVGNYLVLRRVPGGRRRRTRSCSCRPA